jgi:hypothetical protein
MGRSANTNRSASNRMLPNEEKRRLAKFIWVWLATILLLVGVAFPAVTLAILNWNDNPELWWINEIRQRKLRAADNIPHQARLLLAGGSSGAFSVDAELLEARLGVPAVNLSTHAGLGLRPLLADARSVARKGDVVLLYLEDYHYVAKARNITDMERKFMWTYTPGRLWKLPARGVPGQIYSNPFSDYRESWNRLNRGMQGSIWHQGYPFIRQGPRGDFRGTVKSGLPPPAKLSHIEKVNKDAAKHLVSFFAWCGKNDVKVIGVRPASFGEFAEDPYVSHEGVRGFYKRAKVAFVDEVSFCQLPVELFYDTGYHANAAGRRLITERLAENLRPLLRREEAKTSESQDVLLLASRGSGERRDLVLSGVGHASRFLSPTVLNHPVCVSPDQLASLQADGKRLLFADPEVGEILGAAGIGFKTVQTQVVSIKDWIAEYPQHVLAITTAGSFDTSVLGSGMPEPFQSLFQQPAPFKAAIIGTGALSAINFVRTGSEPVSLSLSRHARWQRGLNFPMQFELVSGVEASLMVQFQPVSVDPRPGVHIGVIDPSSGIVVRQGHFTGPTRVEWELREILPIAP